jgi:hypothetical protein
MKQPLWLQSSTVEKSFSICPRELSQVRSCVCYVGACPILMSFFFFLQVMVGLLPQKNAFRFNNTDQQSKQWTVILLGTHALCIPETIASLQ